MSEGICCKCRGRKELVLEGRVCTDCSQLQDSYHPSVTIPDEEWKAGTEWILIAMHPRPKNEIKYGYQRYTNLTYEQMKSIWATWHDPNEIPHFVPFRAKSEPVMDMPDVTAPPFRSASPEEIAEYGSDLRESQALMEAERVFNKYGLSYGDPTWGAPFAGDSEDPYKIDPERQPGWIEAEKNAGKEVKKRFQQLGWPLPRRDSDFGIVEEEEMARRNQAEEGQPTPQYVQSSGRVMGKLIGFVVLAIVVGLIGWWKRENTQDAVAATKDKRASVTSAQHPNDPLPVTHWPDIMVPQLGDVTASLSTMWREGRLYYQFSITPSQILNAARQRSEAVAPSLARDVISGAFVPAPWLSVQLLDSYGFKLIEIKFSVHSLIGVVDEHGKEIRLTANDSVACSREKYASITSWNLAWTL